MSKKPKPILGKVVISGLMHCITGMHVGHSKESMEIGGLDAPVIRDPVTQRPYVPGSSCKGKMRSLLERRFELPSNRHSGQDLYRHECDDRKHALQCKVCRIFGSTGKNGGENHPGRIIVRDMALTEESIKKLERIETGLKYTEWKFENTLDRVTSAAMPRQIERVPAGSEFQFEVLYTVEDREHAREDVLNIIHAMNLLEDDFLGGHGSRGYGKVKFIIQAFEGRLIDYYAAKSTQERQQCCSVATGDLDSPEGRIKAVDEVLQKIISNGAAQ